MKRKCTRAQVRRIDEAALDVYAMSGLILMENAGRGAAQVALDMLGDAQGKRVVIFCGKGNNGGDGYVIARHLHNAGARVDVVLACPVDHIAPEGDAGINLAIVRRMPLPVHTADAEEGRDQAAAIAKDADLIVDALLGTGLSGEVREPFLSLIRLINAADKPVLSVDIPSGLDADTGHVLRAAVRAAHTATFVLAKQGFDAGEGPLHTGPVTVIDIGVPRELIDDVLAEPNDTP